MNKRLLRRTRVRGVTLIELMIVLLVAAILVGIAYPGYQQFVQKARRSEAQIAMTQLAAAQEKLFTRCSAYTQDLVNVASYGTQVAFPCANAATASALSFTTTEGNYTVSAAPPAGGAIATAFVLTATPIAGKAQASDSKCASITLASTGQKGAENSGGTDTTSECWRK